MKVLLLLFAALICCAADPDVARLTEEARAAWNVPGVAVAVVKEGKLLYVGAHGLKEAGKPDSLTEHSLFQIASTSKAFTTTAMAILADEGKLDFDDPVRKHLDYFRLADPHADALVTLRDLVTHRTGLPRHDTLWIRTGFDREDLIRRMAFARPSEPFRAKYQYQNIMFTAAGEAVGKASGLGWDRFLRERIFSPLGMRNTVTLYAEALAKPDRAVPHLKRNGAISSGVWGNYDNIGGAGSIASSIHDMARWLELQVNQGEFQSQRIVSAKSLAETHAPNMFNRLTDSQREMQPEYTQTSYGMGWSINHYRGEMLVMHAGVLSGFRALVTMAPRHKLGFVVLANLNGTNLPEALTNTLLDEFLNLPRNRNWNEHMLAAAKRAEDKQAEDRKKEAATRKPGTRPSLPLAQYQGTYREAAYGAVNISLDQGKLYVEWARFKAPLEHWHYDVFKAKGEGTLSDTMLQFQLDSGGQPRAVEMFGQEFRRISASNTTN
jgi:CubicO group peptidase (beta-lactamase class C family)